MLFVPSIKLPQKSIKHTGEGYREHCLLWMLFSKGDALSGILANYALFNHSFWLTIVIYIYIYIYIYIIYIYKMYPVDHRVMYDSR